MQNPLVCYSVTSTKFWLFLLSFIRSVSMRKLFLAHPVRGYVFILPPLKLNSNVLNADFQCETPSS